MCFLFKQNIGWIEKCKNIGTLVCHSLDLTGRHQDRILSAATDSVLHSAGHARTRDYYVYLCCTVNVVDDTQPVAEPGFLERGGGMASGQGHEEMGVNLKKIALEIAHFSVF